MRLRKLFVATLSLSAVIATTLATAAPSTRPAHDREPWVFRCVLDNNARMIVLSLGNDVWAAYDANRCTLAKVWVGDVEFTGTVFDTRHGPQPKSRGTPLTERALPVEPTRPDATTRPTNANVVGAYQGYRIHGDRATLNFDFNGIVVRETLDVTDVDADAKTVTLRRTLQVEGPITAERAIALETFGSSAARQTKLVEGTLAANADGSPLNAPAMLPAKADANLRFNVARPGTIVIDTTFALPTATASN